MKRTDLLIDTKCPMVGTDKGIAWVCDRYVMVRADLFTRPPKGGEALASHLIRRTLAPSRVNPVAMTGHPPFKRDSRLWWLPATSTNWRLRLNGQSDTMILLQDSRIGSLLINERVARGLWLADAKPYIAAGRVAWWQKRRGKPVLVAVQMPVRITDHNTEWERTS